jgi:hypothetical protein
MTTVLTLAFVASAGPGEAAKDQPMRQLRAAIHDIFTPPRRGKRSKAKQERAAKPDQGSEGPAKSKQDRAAKPDQSSYRPAKTKQDRAAKPDQTDRPARTATAREKALAVATGASVAAREAKPAKASRTTHAKDKDRTEREGRLPAAKDTAPAAKQAAPGPAKETLPAKPPGRPAKTAALPPAAETPAKDAKAGDDAEPEIPPAPSACQLRLTEELAVLQVLPPIKTEQCAVDDVVRLESVVAKDGRRVAMSPPATLRCTMAEAVVHWVRDELAPAEFGAPLKSVSIDTSYECRSRNRIKGAKLSEHGNANAIDVRTVTLTNGKVLGLTDMAVDKALRERIKQGACSRFTTVLGPGSDGYHESHVHLDFIQRRGGYRMCQWDVRDVADVRPMPRERPPEAPPRTASADKPKARN